MTSSFSSSTPIFDVFLSRAEDIRNVFASHLDSCLRRRDISTSLGSEFSYTRIQTSKIAAVLVSKGYLTSVWCLNELQTILNFHDQGRLLVLPIFYKVDVSDITSQTGIVTESLINLRERYPEKVQAWRNALTKLTNIPGLISIDFSTEADLIDAITTKVLAMLFDLDTPSKKSLMLTDPLKTKAQGMLLDSDIPSKKSLTLPEQLTTKVSELVGLDRHMKPLYKLLDLDNSEVRLIGIWGPGGVGKTTLARFAYKDLYNNFHTHMFVDNAENVYYQDPVTTQSEETLTSGVQEGSQKKTRGQVSITVIKSTVGHRKSLLVIDCVDNLEQLKTVAEAISWCGSGSRVILITQGTYLLDLFGVEHVYEVKSMRYDEALKLFHISAFEREYPPASFESLSLRAVQIASFLPLTLKILGSFLQNKNEEEWEKELQKLEGDREKRIIKMMTKPYKREDDKDQTPSFFFK